MALPAFATLEDLEARMGTQSDEPRALARLDDASNRIRSVAYPTTWTTDGVLDEDRPEILLTICCAAAQRSLANPLGVQSTSETIVSYSSQTAYSNASTDVYLTKREIADIRRAAGISAVGTLATSRGELETRSVTYPGAMWPEEETIPW